MKNIKMHDLIQIKNLIERDGKDTQLMLHTLNKQNTMEGIALFCVDCKTIKVFEGKGDGSDDKEMSYEEFIENYDFELGHEISSTRYPIKSDCELLLSDNLNVIEQKVNDNSWQGHFALLIKGDNRCYLVKYGDKIALQYVNGNETVDIKEVKISDINFKNTVMFYNYMCEELDKFISINMENNKKIGL